MKFKVTVFMVSLIIVFKMSPSDAKCFDPRPTQYLHPYECAVINAWVDTVNLARERELLPAIQDAGLLTMPLINYRRIISRAARSPEKSPKRYLPQRPGSL